MIKFIGSLVIAAAILHCGCADNITEYTETETGSVYGTVVDADNKPVEDAKVALLKKASEELDRLPENEIEPVTSSKTDEKGKYKLENVEPGEYLINCMKKSLGAIVEIAVEFNGRDISVPKFALRNNGSIIGKVDKSDIQQGGNNQAMLVEIGVLVEIDKEGGFVFDNVPEYNYTIAVYADNSKVDTYLNDRKIAVTQGDTIRVTEKPEFDSLDVKDTSIVVDQKLSPEITWYPAAADTFVYAFKSGHENIVEIEGDTLIGKKSGTAKIEISVPAHGWTGSFTVVVENIEAPFDSAVVKDTTVYLENKLIPVILWHPSSADTNAYAFKSLDTALIKVDGDTLIPLDTSEALVEITAPARSWADTFSVTILDTSTTQEKVWEGDYRITDSASMKLITGYTRIIGSLTIDSVLDLKNVDFLNSLISVFGKIQISDNRALTSLDGLSAVKTVGRDVYIKGNKSLMNLDGLSAIGSVDGDIDIQYNDALTNLDGLSAITSVGGDININGNHALKNLDGLSAITSVGGDINISGNGALKNLDGLSAITKVDGSVTIGSNDSLVNLKGLNAITSVSGRVEFDDNNALTSLDGLKSLTSVSGDVYIMFHKALTNIDGLKSLIRVGGEITIHYNYALTNIDGLSAVISAGGDIRIENNNALTNLDGLSAVTKAGGWINIEGNSALTNLDGLNAITSADEGINIQYNGALTNLDGLSAIIKVDGDIAIKGNDVLTNLDGLSAISKVDGDISIKDNDALMNLNGLNNLTTVLGNFTVKDNPVLPTCQARNIVDNLKVYSGTTRILGNDTTAVCP